MWQHFEGGDTSKVWQDFGKIFILLNYKAVLLTIYMPLVTNSGKHLIEAIMNSAHSETLS